MHRRSSILHPRSMNINPGSPRWILPTLFFLYAAPGLAIDDDQVEFLAEITAPAFGEYQEALLDESGDRLFLFSVGGISAFDVSLPTSPLLEFHFPPADSVLFYRCYRGHVAGDLLAAGRREFGLTIMDISLSGAPLFLAEHRVSEVSHEGMLIHGGRLYAAAHGAGVEVLDIGDPALPSSIGFVTDLQNAWDLALSADGLHLFVADGAGGLATLDLAGPGLPTLIATAPTLSGALDIALSGELALLACGSGGVEIFDVSNPAAPFWLGNYDSSGLAANLAVFGSRLALADWDDIEIADFSAPFSPFRVGWEKTHSRPMGLDFNGDEIFVADWSALRIFEDGPTSGGDLHLPLKGIAFTEVPLGASIDTLFPVWNTGGGELFVSAVETFNPNFEVLDPGPRTLTSGEIWPVPLRFTQAAPGYDATFLRVSADDPDEPQLSVPLQAEDNPGRLDLGEFAPDFTLLDLEGQPHSLSGYLGKVVILAFFANW